MGGRGEREVRRERGWPCRDAGCLSTWAKIPGVPMPVDPGMSERVSFSPRLGGALSCQVPGRGGFGVIFEPTATRKCPLWKCSCRDTIAARVTYY